MRTAAKKLFSTPSLAKDFSLFSFLRTCPGDVNPMLSNLKHQTRPIVMPFGQPKHTPLSRPIITASFRTFGSTAVLAGSLAGVRTMLTDTNVGGALRTSALVIAGLNAAGFTITALTKSHKITDLTGTTAFIGSVWATHAMHCRAHNLALLQPSKSLLLTAMVSIWGIRLAGFLFSRVLQVGKDSRLDGFFPKDEREPLLTGQSKFPLKLAGFWTTQGLWAWVVCLPVTVAHASLGPQGAIMGAVAYTGAAAWALGASWEAVADYQKSIFKKDPANKGKFIDSGLFAYSRHPNYFGEILAWTGVWLTAGFPGLWLKYPWIAASPGFTAALLLYVSGVPITEESHEKRYGADPKYQTGAGMFALPITVCFYVTGIQAKHKSSDSRSQALTERKIEVKLNMETSVLELVFIRSLPCKLLFMSLILFVGVYLAGSMP